MNSIIVIIAGFTANLRQYINNRRKENFDPEVGHLYVILLVLVAFMQFIQINEVVILFINSIVVIYC